MPHSIDIQLPKSPTTILHDVCIPLWVTRPVCPTLCIPLHFACVPLRTCPTPCASHSACVPLCTVYVPLRVRLTPFVTRSVGLSSCESNFVSVPLLSILISPLRLYSTPYPTLCKPHCLTPYARRFLYVPPLWNFLFHTPLLVGFSPCLFRSTSLCALPFGGHPLRVPYQGCGLRIGMYVQYKPVGIILVTPVRSLDQA